MARYNFTNLGTGKTKLSIKLAKAFNGEIVNADVFQMYQCLDIATAKVSSAEMEGIPHHLISILRPTDTCSAVKYRIMANDAINDIIARGKIPIIVGGNMLYIQTLLWPHQITIDATRMNKYCALSPYDELKSVDPVMAQRWHPNDVRRILRSLNFFYQTG